MWRQSPDSYLESLHPAPNPSPPPTSSQCHTRNWCGAVIVLWWLCHHTWYGPISTRWVRCWHTQVHFDPSTDLSLGGKFVKVLTPQIQHTVMASSTHCPACYLITINRGLGWMSACTRVLSACPLVGIQRRWCRVTILPLSWEATLVVTTMQEPDGTRWTRLVFQRVTGFKKSHEILGGTPVQKLPKLPKRTWWILTAKSKQEAFWNSDKLTSLSSLTS